MLLLYARYIVIFWMLIGSNQGDVLLLQKLFQDERLYSISACTASCLQSHQQPQPLSYRPHQKRQVNQWLPHESLLVKSSMSRSMTIRNTTLTSIAFHQVSTNFIMELVCRTDTSLTFSVNLASYQGKKTQELRNVTGLDLKPGNGTLNSDASGVVYIIKINKAKRAQESFVYLSDDNFFTLTNLSANMTHSLTVFAMRANGQYSMITQDQNFSTLRRGYQPREVISVVVEKFVQDPLSPLLVIAHLQWKPNSDMNCFYDILFFSIHKNDFDLPIYCRDPRSLYNYDIGSLELSGEYKVGVRGINTENKAESAVFWLPFEAPSCLQWHDYNYSLCAPVRPSGLNVTQDVDDVNIVSLNVTWDKPMQMPDYYTVRVLDHFEKEGEGAVYRVAEEANFVYLPKVEINGSTFDVLLTAYTRGGYTTTDEMFIKERPVAVRENVQAKMLFALIIPVLCLTLLSLTFFWGRKAKLRRYKERCKHLEAKQTMEAADVSRNEGFSGVEMATMNSNYESWSKSADSLFFNDEMEISHDDVLLYETLGEGAFGLVRRGMNKGQNVAVKMLRDDPTTEDIQAFRHEIEFMKSVGKHPNIVGLVGHCTKELGSMMLLIEYCSLGNLLNFLRDEWKFQQERKVNQAFAQKTPLNDLQCRYDDGDSKEGSPSDCGIEKSSGPELHYALFNETHIDDLKNLSESNTLETKYLQFELSKISVSVMETSASSVSTLRISATENKSYGFEGFCYCHLNAKTGAKVTDDSSAVGEFEHIEDLFDDEPAEQGDESICTCCGKPKIHMRSGDHRQLSMVENKDYFDTEKNRPHQENADCTEPDERKPLTLSDLLVIARQVAIGMEFLAKNKIVHRDLAARNVLVAADRTVKVADFGLSRDVYHENVYKKTGSGKLPLKWMALESLTHQVYSTKSDVWSFGILLFEIITLGSIPYPTVPSDRLVSLLRMGYRMNKPHECSDEIYRIMYSCWHSSPAERPAFVEIIRNLDELIWHREEKTHDKSASDNSLPIREEDILSQTEIHEGSQADCSYLEPITNYD